MSGLNILLISPYPARPGALIGGVEAVAAALAPGLAALPDVARVTVLTYQYGLRAARCEQVTPKLQIRYLPGQQRLALPTRSFLELWQARRVAAEVKPDIVHGQGIGPSGYIASRVGYPAVITVHGMVTVEARMAARGSFAGRLRVKMIEQRARAALAGARVVIFISSHFDDRLATADRRAVRVIIPNPVEEDFFAAAEDEPAAESTILYAGQIIPRKNVVGILNAFAKVRRSQPQAKLVIAGPEPEREYQTSVHERVKDLGLNGAVRFVGNLDRRELIEQLGRCSAVTLFSWEENLPCILAEAMAMGKPVVSSAVGGVPEMIDDGVNGFLVAPGNEQCLAERLSEVLGKPELGRALGRKGLEKACGQYQARAVARQTVTAYRMAL